MRIPSFFYNAECGRAIESKSCTGPPAPASVPKPSGPLLPSAAQKATLAALPVHVGASTPHCNSQCLYFRVVDETAKAAKLPALKDSTKLPGMSSQNGPGNVICDVLLHTSSHRM